jgi:hypothetical protein
MSKHHYGWIKPKLFQKVICKRGVEHIIWVGSGRLIIREEGFNCLDSCQKDELNKED